MAKNSKSSIEEARQAALDKALGDLSKRYGEGTVMRLGEAQHLMVEVIPTGSLSLDIALGVGGIPRGRVTEIYGPEASGKTTIAQHVVAEAQRIMAQMINAADPAEVVLGSSTTQLLQNLSKSLVRTFKPGDEVIVTNCDHEANIGPWTHMEKQGISVKFWKINPDSFRLDLKDLDDLMTDKTRLVAFTHASKLGTGLGSVCDSGPWIFSLAMSIGSLFSFSAIRYIARVIESQFIGLCCPLRYIFPRLLSTISMFCLTFWHLVVK